MITIIVVMIYHCPTIIPPGLTFTERLGTATDVPPALEAVVELPALAAHPQHAWEGRGCAQKWRVWPSKMVVSTIKKWWFHGLTWFNHQRCGLKHQKWWSQHQKCCFKHQTCGFHHQQWYSNGNIIGILRDITVSPIKSQAFNPFPKGDLILGWVTAKRWRGSDCTVKWFQNRSNLYNRDIRDIRYHIIIIITSFTEISEICYDIL